MTERLDPSFRNPQDIHPGDRPSALADFFGTRRKLLLVVLALGMAGVPIGFFFPRRSHETHTIQGKSPEQRFQELEGKIAEKETRIRHLLGFLGGDFLHRLRRLSIQDNRLRSFRDAVVEILEKNKSQKRTNRYSDAKEALQRKKKLFMEDILSGKKLEPEDVVESIRYVSRKDIEPPFVGFTYFSSPKAEPVMYQFHHGIILLSESLDGSSVIEQIFLLHELIHVEQFRRLLQGSSAEQREFLRRNFQTEQREFPKEIVCIDFESEAVAVSLALMDLIHAEGLQKAMMQRKNFLEASKFSPQAREMIFSSLSIFFKAKGSFSDQQASIERFLHDRFQSEKRLIHPVDFLLPPEKWKSLMIR